MLNSRKVCNLIRKFAGVSEKDHFGGDAFVANKRIFATVWHERAEMNLMLSRAQQQEFVGLDGEGFSEIDNAWGRKGATRVQLEFVDHDHLIAALQAALEHSKVKRK